jgi:hypothetical protein
MTNGAIPEEVKQFLLKNIDSIAQWEGLLLLRAEPRKARDVKSVARDLYITEQEAFSLLSQLVTRGILIVAEPQSSALYQYQPNSPELDKIIGLTADLYRRSVIPITHIIHTKSKNRVQEFADAFKITKD